MAQHVGNTGNRAAVNGQGDDEGVLGKNPKPLWYAVYADRWAHSCVGLSQFHGMTSWDAGSSWGGIGLDTAAWLMRYLSLPEVLERRREEI